MKPIEAPRTRAEILDNARLAVEQDPVRLWLESDERRASLELLKAVRLAPTLEVCEALLRGEKVPRSQLSREWLGRYGK